MAGHKRPGPDPGPHDWYRRGRGFPEDYDPTDDVWLYRNYPRDMTDLVKDCAPRNNALMRNLATGGPE
ncbi:hypothetical protein PG988_015422 [Apiospora saccharicola]